MSTGWCVRCAHFPAAGSLQLCSGCVCELVNAGKNAEAIALAYTRVSEYMRRAKSTPPQERPAPRCTEE